MSYIRLLLGSYDISDYRNHVPYQYIISHESWNISNYTHLPI